VKHSIVVEALIELAFKVFTEEFGSFGSLVDKARGPSRSYRVL
jgi:hypothetical protein